MAFDPNKYRNIFEQRHGKGSYNAGLSSAREIGRTNVQADFAKQEYNARLKEAEKARKEAKKEAERREKNKTYDDALSYWMEPSNNAALRKEGASRNAENIRNDPRLKAALKEQGFNLNEYIDAMYAAASNGQFRSEREFKNFSKAQQKEANRKPTTEELLRQFSKEEKRPVAPPSVKKEQKKNSPSLLNDILTPLKRFGQAINPFDDVSIKEAMKGNVDDALKTDRSPVTKEATRALTRIGNTGTLGTLDQAYKKSRGEQASQFTNEGRSTGGKVADFGYDALGYLIPGAGAYKAVRGVGAGLKPGAQGVNKVRQLAQEGAITGGLLGSGEVFVREGLNPQDTNFKDNLKHIGLGTALGAVADPALYGVGKAAGNTLSKFAKGDVPTYTGRPSENIMNGLRPSAQPSTRGQSNPLYDQLMPNNRLKVEVPAEQRALQRNINDTRSRLNEVGSRVEGYNREFEQAVEQQYQYLKNSMGKGTQSGGLVRDQEGYVTGAYGRVSNNPKWYQDFYSQHGKKPNNQELRELAEQHVREGFEDEVGSLPAWVPKEVQEIDEQIEDLAMLLRQDPSQEPAVRPIIQALEEDKRALLNQIDSARTEYDSLQSKLNQLTSSQSESILPRVQAAASRTVEPPRVGRDFEPIESIARAREPEMQRVSETLLDTQRQSQGNAETFRSRINDTPQKKDNILKGLRTQFVDDVAPLENLEKQIAGKVGSAENSLYKQARLFRGSPEKAHMIVQEQIQPILRDLQTNKINYKDLRDYALAVHAKDVNSKGINSGFTNAEIEDVLSKLGSEQMEAMRKKLLGVNNNVLDMLSTGDKPILSREQVAAMKEKWPNYMSLFRSFDDDKIEFSSGMNKAMANATNPIKKLEGSNRDVIDPIESMVKNIFKAVNAIEKNKVSSQVAKLAEKDVEGNFIRKVADKEDTSRLNVISVLDNGKKVKYEVPPEVYKTLMNLDKESTNTLIKILQKPASTLRAGATLTPEFSLRNPLRDVPHAFVVSESGFNPITDFTYGLVQSIGKGRTIKIGKKEFKVPGEVYKEWVKENGGYGNIISMDRELHRDTLKKALSEVNTNYIDVLDPKTYTSLMKKLANPIGVLRNIADVSESATKVGEFRAAKRKGASPQEAAYRARDIMDFGRAGISVREANKVVAFLNANIQGKSKLWRAFKENPAKVTGKAMAAVTIPTIGAIVAQHTYANDKQREILDDAPQWLKDTFYLVPVPGTNQIARIPKPFDLAFAFSNTIERAADYIYKNDKEAFDDWVKQGFSTAAVPTMLTGIAPLVEGMANYSFFRQGPIIPQREQNMEFPDQYDINTTETAKALGKGINTLTGGQGAFRNFGSPRVIDNTIQGFTGGLGTYGTSAIDYFVNEVSDEERPERPTKSIDQAPLTKAFLVNQSSTGASIDKLYKMKDKLSKQRGSAKTNGREYEKEALYDYVNDVTKEVSDINKEIRTIENAPSLTGDQKKKAVDQLNKLRNDVARQATQQLKSVE
ncbi:LPD38 domain-containing protein [Cytobacillus oceanisediminis]|uniref:LPD38 domain-containing protein n=1 Tax=Cytobacillus oceanisediminis TaxID=665099 RepID=UPI0037357039